MTNEAALFGRFLVERNVLSESKLLEAMMQQIQSTLSWAELIYQQKVLPEKDQLAILMKQLRSAADYRSCAQELGLWSQEIENKLMNFYSQSQTPLVDILEKMGILTRDTMLQLFDAFVAAQEQPAPVKPGFSQALLDECVSSLSERILPSLRDLVLEAQRPPSGDSLETLVPKVLAEFAAIKAAASFLHASACLQLTQEAIDILEDLRRGGQTLLAATLQRFLQLSIQLFEGVHSCLKRDRSEEALQGNSALLQVMQLLRDLRSRPSME